MALSKRRPILADEDGIRIPREEFVWMLETFSHPWRLDDARCLLEEVWPDPAADLEMTPDLRERIRDLEQKRPPEQKRSIPPAVRRRVFDRDGRRCRACGGTDNLSLDHIRPYSRGGRHAVSNLRVLCRSCNSRKHARIFWTWTPKEAS